MTRSGKKVSKNALHGHFLRSGQISGLGHFLGMGQSFGPDLAKSGDLVRILKNGSKIEPFLRVFDSFLGTDLGSPKRRSPKMGQNWPIFGAIFDLIFEVKDRKTLRNVVFGQKGPFLAQKQHIGNFQI